MATDYYLFPDRRERSRNVYEALADTGGGSTSVEPDEVLPKLHAMDWAHPALLVYRSKDEDRWSFVTLGLRKPELGEE